MNIEYTDISNTYIKRFDTEIDARNWIARFNKTAKRLKKISHVKILDNFKKIEYKIIGVKIHEN
jgi:hypothetical protein